MKSLQSLRSRNHKHTLNALAAMFLNEIHSCNSRTAGSQHRVNHNDQTLIDRIRKLAVILMRLMSNRITVKANMTDLGRRNQSSNTVHHTKTCTKNRNNSQLLTGNHGSLASLNRSLNLYILKRKITKCLKTHKNCNLFNKLTEFICSRLFVAENRNLMLDQRMIHNKNIVHI